MSEKIYIHYGADEFDPNKFTVPRYEFECPRKPIGGLWASEDTDEKDYYSWKDWCESESMLSDLSKSFRFKLKDHQKAFVIKDKNVLGTEYAHYQDPDDIWFLSPILIDIDKLKEDGYTHIEFYENKETHYPFYTWDCDCILIIDPTVINPL